MPPVTRSGNYKPDFDFKGSSFRCTPEEIELMHTLAKEAPEGVSVYRWVGDQLVKKKKAWRSPTPVRYHLTKNGAPWTVSV